VPPTTGQSGLPDLGPRGEGWVVGQFLLLGLIVLLTLPALPGMLPRDAAGWLAAAFGGMALVVGSWTLVRGFRDLGPSLTPMPRPRKDAALVESGIYATLRHPIYAGLIVAGLGWSTLARSLPALAVAGMLSIYLDLKSRREEAWLAERYPGYAAYRERTRRFVPGLY
jgi:protein-S-isoprenylcysteine O-methyltransferase Ste14